MRTVDQKDKKPLYLQLKEVLLEEIASGSILANGNRLPSLREITETHQVSLITVSRAVSELVKEGFVYSRPGKGIFVLDMKKVKNRFIGPSSTIGVTFLDLYNISSPYFLEVFKGISEVCNEENINLQVFSTSSKEIDPEENPLFWSNLKKKNLAGLILASRMQSKDIVLLQQQKVPFVWIANTIPHEPICSVLLDKCYGLSFALEHLTGLGHRRIGLINSVEDKEVLSAYQLFLTAKGLEIEPGLIKEEKMPEKEEGEEEIGYQLGKELLLLKPEAILALGGNCLSLGVMKAIKDEGLNVPEDIALVGAASSANFPFPLPLTVIVNPLQEMARLGVQMLIKLIRKEEISEPKLLVKPYLIIRQSSLPLQEELIIRSLSELKERENDLK